MISALFDLIGAAFHFLWNLLAAVLDLSMSLLSAVATVLSWPAKAAWGLLSGTVRWTPAFLFICAILFVLVIGCAVLAVALRLRRR